MLLTTGSTFDVIEVVARLGHTAHSLLGYRGARCPTAVTPAGRWMFYVTAGEVLRPELAARPDVIRHAAGSAVPAPPSRAGRPAERVRWAVSPDRTGWQPGDPAAVQQALTTAVAALAAVPKHRRPWWAPAPAR